MKKLNLIAIAMMAISSSAFAQTALDSHQLTLTVTEINQISVDGDVSLVFGKTSPAGSKELDPETGMTAVHWTTNSQDHKKITIKANTPISGDHFVVTAVLDDGVSPGAAAVTGTSEVTLLSGIHANDRGYTDGLPGGQATLMYSVQPFSTLPVLDANVVRNIEMTLTISDM